MVDLSKISKQDFDPHIHTHFIFSDDDHMIHFELIEAQDSSSNNVSGFSLLFKGPIEKQYPQSVFPLEHEKMGKLELFMVPVSKDDEGFYYQAVFTRLEK